MKKLTLSLLVSASVLALSGCGSTSNKSASEPKTNIKALQVASMDEYQWDNDKSFAFNMARLSNPAGVGYGMSDSVNPKGTDLGRSDSSLLSGISGFMLGGLGGAAGFLSMDSDSNAKRDWNTSIVTFYDESELNITDPVDANEKVRRDVSEKLIKALQIQYPDTVLEGSYAFNSKDLNIAVTVLSGKVCQQAYEFGRLDKIDYDITDTLKRISRSIPVDTSSILDGCAIFFESIVTGKVNGKVAVVSEMDKYNVNTFIINTAGPKIEGAYIIYPDRSTYLVAGSKRKHFIPYAYPNVSGNGKEFLLDSKQTSSVHMID